MILALLCAAAVRGVPLHIGEYYTDGLAGLAIFTNSKDSLQMQIGWPGPDGKMIKGYSALMDADPRFGAAAPDDSYHEFDWKVGKARVRYEWGRIDADSAVVRISADHEVRLYLLFGPAWQGHSPSFNREKGAIKIRTGQLRLTVATPKESREFSNGRENVVELDLSPGRADSISLSRTQPLRTDAVGAWLDESALRYQNERTRAQGTWGDFVSPIPNELGHSRVYSPGNGRIAHTVSRRWCLPDGQVLFCWDSFFNGLLSSVENPSAGRETIRALLAAQVPNGIVANFSGRTWGRSDDRSQPPVGSMCIWKMYLRDPDKAFLAEVFPKLLKWHRWWFASRGPGKPANRDGNGDGLLEWGSETGDLQNAKFESGLDDSPMFDTGQMKGPNMDLDATDLNALWAMDSDYLARIATVLGHKKDAADLRKDHSEMVQRMNRLLWNDQLGIYCYRYWNPRHPSRSVQLNSVMSSGQGPGLKAEFFKGRDLQDKVGERIDEDINFHWDGSPVSSIGKNNFSIRWTGTCTVKQTNPYVFSTFSDDGARLWLDGKLLIDDWEIHGTKRSDSPEVRLTAGEPHPIRIEYFQAVGGAEIRVELAEIEDNLPGATLLPRLSPLNFYPMMANAPSKSQAKRMLDLFFRADKFDGETICPTISRDDPAYPGQGYWRGTIWGPTSYLFYQGLRRYGTDKQRTEFAQKSEALFLKNWKNDGTCHENFNAITGWGRSDPHYTWGSLLCLLAIEELCDIEPNGKLRLNGISGAHVTIRNLRLMGKNYDLKIGPRTAVLSRNGRVLAEAKGRAREFPASLLQ